MKILFVSRQPYGVLTDLVKMAETASVEWKVSIIAFDHSVVSSRVSESKLSSGQRLVSVGRRGSKLRRLARLFTCIKSELQNNYDIIYVYYFPFCSVLHLITKKNQLAVLDVRTLSVCAGWLRRAVLDALIWLECRTFQVIHIISAGIRDKLQLHSARVQIVGVGGDKRGPVERDYSRLRFLYVGTLTNRHIEKTIRPFVSCHRAKPHIFTEYTIVGGTSQEVNSLRTLVASLKGERCIRILGSMDRAGVAAMLEECNAGVAFVPITDYFEHQPPTKTVEYLLAGMPVVATGTFANRSLVTHRNGVICSDNEKDLIGAFQELGARRASYNAEVIRSTVNNLEWSRLSRAMLSNLHDYWVTLPKSN